MAGSWPAEAQPPVREAVAGVLVGATGALHDSVECHVVYDDDSHGLTALPALR
jgi:hypothetical protein